MPIKHRVEKYLFLLACLLSGLPVWLPRFPPMVDLPQHAAQIALFLNLQDANFPFVHLFDIHLFTPYLFGYSLIAGATPLLGIVTASKLVISLALAAFPLSNRYFLSAAGADPYLAWLVFPVLYGFSYQWGFINFIVAAPIGMLFLGLVWRQQRQANLYSALLMTCMLYLLFFSHALILALFGGIAAIYWWCATQRIKKFMRLAWPLLTPLPLLVTWVTVNHGHPMSKLPIEWDLSWFRTIDWYYVSMAAWINPEQAGWGRVNGFIPRLLGVRPDIILTLFGLLLFLLPFLAGYRVTTSRTRLIPFGVLVTILLLAPSLFFGVAFVFQRFTFLALPFFLFMLEAPRGTKRPYQQWISGLAPIIAFSWVALMAGQALQFNKDAEGFEAILAQMAPGKRALSMMFERDDSFSIAPTFVHFAAWYSALKRGVTDPSFAVTQIQPITYRSDQRPSVGIQGFEWFPQKFDWKYHAGRQYDYFVARAPIDHGASLFREATCRIELVAQEGHWWLYQRDSIC